MIKFTSYFGSTIWIDPSLVTAVVDGGFGSRGVHTVVHFTTGTSQSLNEEAEYVARAIGDAKAALKVPA